MKAVEWMKQGKKVRQPHWRVNKLYLHKQGDSILWSSGNSFITYYRYLEATDWEVVEEPKKTLSDKTFEIRDEKVFIGTMFRFSDIADFIKRVKERMEVFGDDVLVIQCKKIIDEEAGERLIE